MLICLCRISSRSQARLRGNSHRTLNCHNTCGAHAFCCLSDALPINVALYMSDHPTTTNKAHLLLPFILLHVISLPNIYPTSNTCKSHWTGGSEHSSCLPIPSTRFVLLTFLRAFRWGAVYGALNAFIGTGQGYNCELHPRCWLHRCELHPYCYCCVVGSFVVALLETTPA